MTANEYKRKNLQFKIAFSETNLRFLYAEPESERRAVAIATNQKAIKEAKIKLAEMNKEEP